MTPLTQEWVRKVEGDYEAARLLIQSPGDPADSVCFHAHACIEKYLKARLQETGIAFPKTHDLEVLLNLVLPVEPTWAGLRTDLKLLNRFAVEYRYPGFDATATDARESFQKAERLRGMLRAVLGLST